MAAPPGLSAWDSAAVCASPQLSSELDRLGAASAIAQHLAEPITSAQKLCGSDHRIYLHSNASGTPSGFLKVGVKHLFYLTPRGAYIEFDPLCVLDFYVVESEQRKGLGIALFNYMIECEGNAAPKDLAYDRPSPKLLPFLRKHFGLIDFFQQPNRYVVFGTNAAIEGK